MKIVFLNPVGTLGGAERVLLTALAGLCRTAPDSHLTLLTAADGPLLVSANDLGVKTEVLTLPPSLARLGDSGPRKGVWNMGWDGAAALSAVWAYAARLRQRLKRLAPDLIHSNGLKTHLFAAVARPPRIPVIWHVHDFYGLRPVIPWLLRPARRGVAAALAVSQAVADDFRRVLPGVRTAVILNGIDTNIFSPGPGDGAWLDGLAGMPPAVPGVVRIGLVAAYALWKGHGVFLEAAALVAKAADATPTRFYVVGGPVYQTSAQLRDEDLRRRAAELGLEGRVGFVGFQQETAPVYRALDIVVHASTQPEPFGLTIVEAMACARPVVAVQAGAGAELFIPGHDALGVPPGDPSMLAHALHRLCADAVLRRRLGGNARETAVRRFNADRIGPQLLALYWGILRRPKVGSFSR